MPATPKTAAGTAPNRASKPPVGKAALNREPQPPSLEMARNLFNASLAPLHGMLRFMTQMRDSQADLLRDMEKALGVALRQAEGATELQELVRLQGELASENLGRTANAASALFRSWLDTEAALLEQAQAQGVDLTRKLIQEAPVTTASKSPMAVDAGMNPALTLLSNAQSAWTQMTQEWLDNVRNGAAH